MSRFILSPAAREDLLDIWDWNASYSMDAADRIQDQIERAILRLAENPGIGHRRDDLADEMLRIWPVRSYLIIYRPAATPLEIVRIISGYRDLPTALQDPTRAP